MKINNQKNRHSRKYLPWIATLGILVISVSTTSSLAMCVFKSNNNNVKGQIQINGSSTQSAIVGEKISDLATLTLTNALSSDVAISLVDDKDILIAGSTCEVVQKPTIVPVEYFISISCSEILTNQSCKIFVFHDSKKLCESTALDISFAEDPTAPKCTFGFFAEPFQKNTNHIIVGEFFEWKNIDDVGTVVWTFKNLTLDFMFDFVYQEVDYNQYTLYASTVAVPDETTSIDATLMGIYKGKTVFKLTKNWTLTK